MQYSKLTFTVKQFLSENNSRQLVQFANGLIGFRGNHPTRRFGEIIAPDLVGISTDHENRRRKLARDLRFESDKACHRWSRLRWEPPRSTRRSWSARWARRAVEPPRRSSSGPRSRRTGARDPPSESYRTEMEKGIRCRIWCCVIFIGVFSTWEPRPGLFWCLKVLQLIGTAGVIDLTFFKTYI